MSVLDKAATHAVTEAEKKNRPRAPRAERRAKPPLPVTYPRTFVRTLNMVIAWRKGIGMAKGTILELVDTNIPFPKLAVDDQGLEFMLRKDEFEVAEVREAKLEYVAAIGNLKRDGTTLVDGAVCQVLEEFRNGSVQVMTPAGQTAVLQLGEFAAVFADEESDDENDDPKHEPGPRFIDAYVGVAEREAAAIRTDEFRSAFVGKPIRALEAVKIEGTKSTLTKGFVYVGLEANADGGVRVKSDDGHFVWLKASQFELGDAAKPNEGLLDLGDDEPPAAAAEPKVETPRRNGRSVRRSPPEGDAGPGAAKRSPGNDDAKAAEAAAVRAIAGLPVVELRVEQLIRHPENRVPTPADVDDLAASLHADGQLEPCVVWVPPGYVGTDKHQIISGETRWLGAKKNKWQTVRCKIVVGITQAKALELLVLFNAKRHDLNPIQKALNIQNLCDAEKMGGQPMTREQAAKTQGLESGAAASNLVRLLQLPEVWQKRVANGELQWTWARALTAIAKAPKLLQEAEESWKEAHGKNADDWEYADKWASRSAVESLVDGLLRYTRPLDDKAKRTYYSEKAGRSGEFPRLFELTPENRKKIGAATVTIDGKEVEVATDCAAFDALQRPLVDAKLSGKAKSKAAAAAADDDGPEEKSPAEIKAARKKKAEQLQRNIDGWRSIWLKSLIIDRLEANPRAARRVMWALLVGGYSEAHSLLANCCREALAVDRHGNRNLAKAWPLTDRPSIADDLADATTIAVKQLLSEEDREPRQPLLPFEFIDAVAATLKIDVAKEWKLLQMKNQDRVEEFLMFHNSEQLQGLADEWNLGEMKGTKADKVATFVACSGNLDLPKSIKPLKAPKAAGGKKSAKKKSRGAA